MRILLNKQDWLIAEQEPSRRSVYLNIPRFKVKGNYFLPFPYVVFCVNKAKNGRMLVGLRNEPVDETMLFKETVNFIPLPNIFENFEVCLGDEIDEIRKMEVWQARDVVSVFWQTQFDEADVWDGVEIARSLFGCENPYCEWEKIKNPTAIRWDQHGKAYLRCIPIGLLLTLGDRPPEQMENGDVVRNNKAYSANRKPLDDVIDEFHEVFKRR